MLAITRKGRMSWGIAGGGEGGAGAGNVLGDLLRGEGERSRSQSRAEKDAHMHASRNQNYIRVMSVVF